MPEPPSESQWPAGPDPIPSGGAAAKPTAGRRRIVGLGLAVVAIAIVVFVLVSSTSTKLDPVAQAATRSANAPGYRARISMVMSSPSLPGGITMTGGGVVSSSAHAASISMTMTLPNLPAVTSQLGGDSLQITEILRGTTVYVELPQALASKLPFSKRWLSVNVLKAAGVQGLSSLSGGLGAGSSDPSQFLQYLRAASDSVVATGHARVDGYDTTHYQAQVDFGKVADALPAAERPAIQRALTMLGQQAQLGTIPVDVWIDRSHLVRRIGMTLNMTIKGTSMSAQIVEDLSDYGPQPTPAPPPADQVQQLN